MRLRIAALLLAVLPAVTPAYADDAEKGIKIGAGFAGTITASSSLSDILDGSVPTLTVVAICGFDAALLPNNRLTIGYGGSAIATGANLPEITYVKCDISNPAGQSAYSENGGAGGAVATAALAGPWLVQEIQVCVTAFAVFGPPPRIVSIPRTCESIV